MSIRMSSDLSNRASSSSQSPSQQREQEERPQQQQRTTIAIITCGRIAPCFGPAVGGFLQRYGEVLGSHRNPDLRLIAYRHGFRGLLRGEVIEFGPEHIAAAPLLASKGGSPIGASRTRLSNMEHLRLRGLIAEGEDDAYEAAARQLKRDNVTVLHVVGSSHAQLTAQRLSAILREKHGHFMRSIGLAKTLENDMYPVQMTLGALTAAEHGAIYFENVVPEHNSNPRMLIIHEIKGRAAGWLAAATAREYRWRLDRRHRFPSAYGQSREVFDVHAVYTPEMVIDFASEVSRLRRCMDRHDNVNIFVAQGTAQALIEGENEKTGVKVERHPSLGYPVIDTAAWFAKKFKSGVGAEKVLIQRSGVYVRAAPAGKRDRRLVQSCVNFAVDLALDSNRDGLSSLNGVVGHDVRYDGQLRLIEPAALERKREFDLSTPWFVEMLAQIGQPQESQSQISTRRRVGQQQQRTASSGGKKSKL